MTGLPASGTTWPPKPHDQVLTAATEGQVWWEGDPEKLAAFYGGKAGDAAALGRVRRTFQAAKAAWWGKTHTPGSDPKRLHVPVAADICRVSASTLFSAPVTFSDPAENKKLSDRIDTILNTPETYSRLLVAAESASALSGVYGRIVWDKTVDEHTWIDWVDADRAVPEFTWGKLTAVTFWTELDSDDDRTVWRHLERYEKGVILHGLYQGTKDQLGTRHDLDHHDATAGLSDAVELPGVKELAARYVPNHRPAPQWRGTPALRDLGRSDLTADVIHLMDAIDKTWSSWMNDLDLGRGRLIVSEDLLTARGLGLGTHFDTDKTIFTPVGAASDKGELTHLMEANQFEIRVEEHQRTYIELLRRVISRVGFSPITFGLQDEVAATATEVDAKERDTNATRSARIRLWSGLAELATIQLAVDAAIFGQSPAPTETVTVDWPSMHQESDRQRAETVQLWEQARAASVDAKVRMLHPEWDDQRVDDEVAAINGEQAMPVSIVGPTEQDFPGQPVETDDADAVDAPIG